MEEGVWWSSSQILAYKIKIKFYRESVKSLSNKKSGSSRLYYNKKDWLN
jgi:hypothetical protein